MVKKESSKKIFQRIFKGSYPELYKNPKIDIEMFYSSYLRTYIERDARKIINVQNMVNVPVHTIVFKDYDEETVLNTQQVHD